jgi:hypothetical protein
LEHKKAQKLIDKIITDLEHAGIITNTFVADLKELRPYAVEEKRPAVAKSLRMASEHVEEFETFDIPIPDDEPIEDEEMETSESKPMESLIYLMNLIKQSDNPRNLEEIREYNEAMRNYDD